MDMRLLSDILLPPLSIIILGSSCVPNDRHSTRAHGRGSSHTTSPSTSSREDAAPATEQVDGADVAEDIQQLIANLDSEDASVRIEAARSLYKHAHRAAPAIPALLAHLTDEDATYDSDLKFTVGDEALHALKATGSGVRASLAISVDGAEAV